jgi:hypothetical protein
MENDVKELKTIMQDNKFDDSAKAKLIAFDDFEFNSYDHFLIKDKNIYDNVKSYKGQRAQGDTNSNDQISRCIDKFNRRQYLNPDQYYGIGAELKHSFTHEDKYYFQFTDKYNGSLAEQLGINVGDYLIIDKNELNDDKEIDSILLVTRKLRSNDLRGITNIGKYDISEQKNKDVLNEIFTKFLKASKYKKNLEGSFSLEDSIKLPEQEKDNLSSIEKKATHETITAILGEYRGIPNDHYKEYLITQILEFDLNKIEENKKKKLLIWLIVIIKFKMIN